MIDFILDENSAVLTLRPTGPLRKEDFDALSRAMVLSLIALGACMASCWNCKEQIGYKP